MICTLVIGVGIIVSLENSYASIVSLSYDKITIVGHNAQDIRLVASPCFVSAVEGYLLNTTSVIEEDINSLVQEYMEDSFSLEFKNDIICDFQEPPTKKYTQVYGDIVSDKIQDLMGSINGRNYNVEDLETLTSNVRSEVNKAVQELNNEYREDGQDRTVLNPKEFMSWDEYSVQDIEEMKNWIEVYVLDFYASDGEKRMIALSCGKTHEGVWRNHLYEDLYEALLNADSSILDIILNIKGFLDDSFKLEHTLLCKKDNQGKLVMDYSVHLLGLSDMLSGNSLLVRTLLPKVAWDAIDDFIKDNLTVSIKKMHVYLPKHYSFFDKKLDKKYVSTASVLNKSVLNKSVLNKGVLSYGSKNSSSNILSPLKEFGYSVISKLLSITSNNAYAGSLFDTYVDEACIEGIAPEKYSAWEGDDEVKIHRTFFPTVHDCFLNSINKYLFGQDATSVKYIHRYGNKISNNDSNANTFNLLASCGNNSQSLFCKFQSFFRPIIEVITIIYLVVLGFRVMLLSVKMDETLKIVVKLVLVVYFSVIHDWGNSFIGYHGYIKSVNSLNHLYVEALMKPTYNIDRKPYKSSLSKFGNCTALHDDLTKSYKGSTDIHSAPTSATIVWSTIECFFLTASLFDSFRNSTERHHSFVNAINSGLNWFVNVFGTVGTHFIFWSFTAPLPLTGLGGPLLAIGYMFFAAFTILIGLRILQVFLFSITLVAMFMLFAPIVVVLSLFESTKETFSGWSKEVLSYIFIPVCYVMFGFLVLLLYSQILFKHEASESLNNGRVAATDNNPDYIDNNPDYILFEKRALNTHRFSSFYVSPLGAHQSAIRSDACTEGNYAGTLACSIGGYGPYWPGNSRNILVAVLLAYILYCFMGMIDGVIRDITSNKTLNSAGSILSQGISVVQAQGEKMMNNSLADINSSGEYSGDKGVKKPEGHSGQAGSAGGGSNDNDYGGGGSAGGGSNDSDAGGGGSAGGGLNDNNSGGGGSAGSYSGSSISRSSNDRGGFEI